KGSRQHRRKCDAHSKRKRDSGYAFVGHGKSFVLAAPDRLWRGGRISILCLFLPPHRESPTTFLGPPLLSAFIWVAWGVCIFNLIERTSGLNVSFRQQRTCRCISSGPSRARYCCKTLFALLIKNSPGYRRDARVKMWGTSSPDDKLVSDLAKATEAIKIAARRSDRLMAGK